MGFQTTDNTSTNKAKFITEDKQEIVLQFNPNEYEFSEDVVYSGCGRDRNRGKNKNSLVEFTGYKAQTLTLTLHFDTSSVVGVNGTSRSATNVKNKTDEIEALTKVVESLHRPPVVQFLWGEIDFTGMISTVKTTFSLFSKEGIPIRAKMIVTMQAAAVSTQDKTKLVLSSPDRTKTRVLSEDVSIWSLAQNEYGDMGEWKRIAKANEILNPFEIETGKVLKIPAIVKED